MMLLIINYYQQLLGVGACFNANEEREVLWNSEKEDWTVFSELGIMPWFVWFLVVCRVE